MQANHKVPAGWRFELLDNLAKRGSGHTPDKTKPDYWNGGIKWISLADSSQLDKGYIHETDKEISATGLKNSSAVLHPAETVVLSRDAGVGKSAVMAEPMAVSQHFMAWQCDNQHTLNSWFLYYWLQMMKPEFERQAVGSTIKTIGLPYFKKLRILAPSYTEQTKIAQILSTWDKAIATTEFLLANSQQQKQALMQQLLTGQTRFPIFIMPWTEFSLDRLFTFGRGKALSKADISTEGTTKCILYGELYTKYKEVVRRVFSRTNSNEGEPSKSGDILIPSSTTTSAIDLANATAILEDGILLGGDIIILRPKTEDIDSTFFAYLLTHIKKNEIAALAQGITIIHLYGSELKKLNVLTPSLPEQQKIAQVLSTADAEISNLQAQLAKLKLEKKALMQQLLTGQRRVMLDDEVEAQIRRVG